jgi:endoglucanase
MLRGGAGVLALATAAQAPLPGIGTAEEDWADFKRRFLAPEGRIVDTGNRNASHSEGQGYGLLAALWANDQTAFNRMLSWTYGNLRRRQDQLFAWRFQPGMEPPVSDPNNATDGDLLIAWALLEASAQWRIVDFRSRGLAIARDVLRNCVAQVADRWVLLPGAYGFRAPTRVVLNLSYYLFPALRAFGREGSDPVWPRLERDGVQLLREARFGRWSLPPDWLELRADARDMVPAPAWPARFSFDAVRIPLNLGWVGLWREPAVLNSLAFWTSPDHRAVPAWSDLRSGQIAPFPASSGMVAIARLAAAMTGGRTDATQMPRVGTAPDYYAAALTLLARQVWRDAVAAR